MTCYECESNMMIIEINPKCTNPQEAITAKCLDCGEIHGYSMPYSMFIRKVLKRLGFYYKPIHLR